MEQQLSKLLLQVCTFITIVHCVLAGTRTTINMLSRYNDPPYVKVKKLEVLTEVCNVENAQYIVDELG